MAEILGYKEENDGVRYYAKFCLQGPKTAEYFVASCLMGVRMKYGLADLYAKGNVLILDTPDEQATKSLSNQLRKVILEKNYLEN